MRITRRTAGRFLSLLAALLLLPALVAAAKKSTPPVVPVDGPGLRKAIARHRGKVVLVNFWATWCKPCVEEFPDLVKLHEAYRGRGLVVMAVSVDEPETQGQIAPFLARQKATFLNYSRKPGDVEAFINAFDKNWSGAVPITYLFDRDGKPVGSPLLGPQSYAKLAAAVEPLLRQPR